MAQLKDTRGWISYTNVPADLAVYHGSRCVGERTHPDGPAWFSWLAEVAGHWGMWGEAPPKGRSFGQLIIYRFSVMSTLPLIDIGEPEHWEQLGLEFLDDGEPSPYALATAFKQRGLAGWVGPSEMMLVEPHRHLRYLTRAVITDPKKLPPLGRTLPRSDKMSRRAVLL